MISDAFIIISAMSLIFGLLIGLLSRKVDLQYIGGTFGFSCFFILFGVLRMAGLDTSGAPKVPVLDRPIDVSSLYVSFLSLGAFFGGAINMTFAWIKKQLS